MILQKFSDVLAKEEIKELADGILKAPRYINEDSMFYYKNSLGLSNLPITFKHIEKLTDLLSSVYNGEVKFANTYSRIYRNGSYLKIHTDRPGLDFTMSLCVKKEISSDWPLCVSSKTITGAWKEKTDPLPYKEKFTEILLDENEAGLMEGITYPHWRDELSCGPNERMIFVFYHWTKRQIKT